MDHVSRGFYATGIPSPLDGLVYVTIQELATRIAHRNTGAITGDPAAERMMARIALDENLHYVFYRDVASGALAVDPSATVLAIHRQVLGFAMPGFELPSFREKAIRIASAGIYDLRIHHDQVLTPVLRHWKLPDLDGLTDEASRAREEILDFMERLDDAADRFEAKRAS
jgi:acyl-[acyl-carrier-protein] desaturase